jgi:epoxyqueuosine reductase
MLLSKSKYTSSIKSEALRLGFDFCGISKADFLKEEAPLLEKWLLENKHGKMSYMQNYFDKRLDPRELVPGAKSVISLLYNYYTDEKQDSSAPKISKYAYGRDYHFVVKEKLKELVNYISENIGQVSGRVFVDSAPVLERAWAKKSGLGWVGKNTNLINRQSGSFFFIAEIICDLELDVDGPIEDYCGTCTRCIDACPTDAIIQPYVVDGSKCISYFTIELKEEIPAEVNGKMDEWIFGCDICQDVCPWNSFSKAHKEKQFLASEKLMGMKEDEWHEITAEVFEKLFHDSPVMRAGFKGLKRNLDFIRKKIS